MNYVGDKTQFIEKEVQFKARYSWIGRRLFNRNHPDYREWQFLILF